MMFFHSIGNISHTQAVIFHTNVLISYHGYLFHTSDMLSYQQANFIPLDMYFIPLYVFISLDEFSYFRTI
jgi:hypothetical protein